MSESIFLRLLTQNDKASAMVEAISSLNEGQPNPLVYIVDSTSFRQVPSSPFAYWVSEHIKQLFAELPRFESEERMVRQGGVTGDDPRYVRAHWEVSPANFRTDGVAWVPYSKGGNFSPYWSDLSLVVHWDFERGTFYGYTGLPHRPSEKPSSANLYFRPGFSWARRTYRFSPYVVPAGCIFSVSRYQAFVPTNDLDWCLGFLNGIAITALLRMSLENFERPNYIVGIVAALPFPSPSLNDKNTLATIARLCVSNRRQLFSTTENGRIFNLPALLQTPGKTLSENITAWKSLAAAQERELEQQQQEIDNIVFKIYGISEIDRQSLEASLPKREHRQEIEEELDNEQDNADESEQVITDHKQLIADLISYAVGCAYGRWDIRIGRDGSLAPPLADPFDPLPICAPGALIGPDGLPAKPGHIVSEAWLRARPDAITLPPEGGVAQPTIPDDEYPLAIAWDGILVDDPDHEADILRCARAGLDLLWGERAEAIEAEACSILSVRDLRDYFRNPRNFFNHHIGRYSKSRRKAPIYWLLQSSSKRYGIWLYYHRLDPDLLFKALTLYVQPKIRLEESRLHEMRSICQSAGNTGAAARQAGQAVERQETLLADLRDFHDRLERATKLYLTPDLNDGVLLNIAPFWELVPWKEAKSAWEQLLAGKYGWSSIGKQLREKGLVKEK